MSERWLGWHFLKANGRTGAKNLVVKPGQIMSCRGPIELCSNGLHASVKALDALQYAPGSIVQRVELIGERLDESDKSCARRRRCLWVADATTVLHEFAIWCAEESLKLVESPDPRSVAAIAAKRAWLRGEITAEELDAARDAARAARDAAWAASAAARDARAASAASAAASAASAAAWAVQNTQLEGMLLQLEPNDNDTPPDGGQEE